MLKQKQMLAQKFLADPNIDEYLKAGFISERDIRNCAIINDYIILRKDYKHLDALEILASKYFLSTDRLQYILYQKCKKEKIA